MCSSEPRAGRLDLQPARARAAAGLFRAPALEALARGRRARLLEEMLRHLPVLKERPLGDAYDSIFDALRRGYRCEYLFKNAIATRILLDLHDVAEATLLTELRADGCKADTVVLNGTSTVYEVKTGLDNLSRLPTQLAAYSRLFDRVYVVVEPEAVGSVTALAPPHVGILSVDHHLDLAVEREHVPNAVNTSSEAIFRSLRVAEYFEIIRDEMGFVPEVPNGLRYTVCRALFEKIPPERAHAGMVRVMKRRFRPFTGGFVHALPHSLKAAGLTTRLGRAQQERLLEALAAPYSPC